MMKSIKSYFNVSPTLIKENFKQFWPIPVFGFIFYFLLGVFPILMSYSNTTDVANTISSILTNSLSFIMVVHLILPIIAANAAFKYLHSSNSVTVIHSMPFSRVKLFNSSMISGWLMSILPMMLTGLLLLLLAKGTYLEGTTENIYTASSCLVWILDSTVIITFIYSISVFAGIISGNNIIHILLSFFLNFVASILFAITSQYLHNFMFGYPVNASFDQLSIKLSPYIYSISEYSSKSIFLEITYLISAIIIIAISLMLYKKIQLEREGDSLVFKNAGHVLSYIIAFFGMTLIGYYFAAISGSISEKYLKEFFVLGCIVGATIFFFISRMIIEKALKVFYKKNLINLGIFAIIGAVFLALTVFDVSGYSSRVPDVANIKSVQVENIGTYSYKSTENIDQIIALQKEIIKNSNENNYSNSEGTFSSLQVTYTLKNGDKYTRTYNYTETPKTKKYNMWIFESKSFKEYNSIYNESNNKLLSVYNTNTKTYDSNTKNTDYNPKDIVLSYVTVSGNYQTNSLNIYPKNSTGLLNAMDKDFNNRTYEQTINYQPNGNEIVLTYKDSKKTYVGITHMIYPTDKYTIAWLQNNGYYKGVIDFSSMETQK